MNLSFISCPYCGLPFREDQDVVVCPDCGTPAHRTCYKTLGHCINEEDHGDGFSWKVPDEIKIIQDTVDEAKAAKAQEPVQQASAQPDAAPFNPLRMGGPYGAYQSFSKAEDGSYRNTYKVIDGNDLIGEYTAEEYGLVVQKNMHKFIPKFMMIEKEDRIISWNWAAFFFPYFWLAYRKMYGLAIAVAIISLIIPVTFVDKVADYYTESMSIVAEIQTGEAEENAAMPDTPTVLRVQEYISLFIEVSLALFANYLYKLHCDKLLKKAQDLEGDGKTAFFKRNGGASLGGLVIFTVVIYSVVSLATAMAVNYGVDLATLIWRIFN